MHLQDIYLKIINRLNSNLIWQRYANLCKKSGINKSIFILSFDCDTKEDIVVALDVHKRLQNMGITPVYAVPGELLKQGEKVYRNIHETGAEFINHGGRAHTYFDTQRHRHESCFFYDQHPLELIREDILNGHKTLQDVLGINATGFRTPHFGTFQKLEHLEFLYAVLEELNYNFSTSTCPDLAYKNGPFYKQKSLYEIPVTGRFTEPFNIMDTWAYFAAPDRTKSIFEYIKEAQNLTEFSKKSPVLINIYGDPSHIHDKPEFFEAMALLAQAAKNINYTQLLEKIYENIRTI